MTRTPWLWPLTTAALGAASVGVWLHATAARGVALRAPEPEIPLAPIVETAEAVNPGKLIRGPGKPSRFKGDWPQFRGADRSNIAHPPRRLARAWPKSGLKVLWRVKLGDGFAGAAVRNGRAYVVDHDLERNEDAIRCLSLDDGQEIWRYTYTAKVRPFHGESRTVPAVNDRFLVAFGPLCQVTCLDAVKGVRLWQIDLVKQYHSVVPEWYAGQCPLIDGDAAILAPAGDALLIAVELATGRVLWRTPNPDGWQMTHSSVMPMTFEGRKQYLYCASEGVAGVDAQTGRLLWKLPGWKVPMANVPSPVVIPPDRIFLTGGYRAGSLMIRLTRGPNGIRARKLFRLTEKQFGAEQQTPILYQGYLYGIASPKTRSELVCLGLDGRRVWSSGRANRYELGPFLLADGLLLVLDGEKAVLHLIEATPRGFHHLAQARVLRGKHAWAPMALAGDRLLLRDFSEMACVELP